jgi:CheY-like chemotaxis protein
LKEIVLTVGPLPVCFRPEMDGPEASKLIRSKNKSVPIVALTANASTDSRDECYASGMTGFLTKPVNLKDLTDTIKRALAWREKNRSVGVEGLASST